MFLSKKDLEELLEINKYIKDVLGYNKFYNVFVKQTIKKLKVKDSLYNEFLEIAPKEPLKYSNQIELFINFFENKIEIPEICTILDLRNSSYGKQQKEINKEYIQFFLKRIGEDNTFNLVEDYLYFNSINNNLINCEDLYNYWVEQLIKNTNKFNIEKASTIINEKTQFLGQGKTIQEKKIEFKSLVLLNKYKDVEDLIIKYKNYNNNNALFEKYSFNLLSKNTNIKINKKEYDIIKRDIIMGIISFNENYLIDKFNFNKNKATNFLYDLYKFLEEYNKDDKNHFVVSFNELQVSSKTIEDYQKVNSLIKEQASLLMDLAPKWKEGIGNQYDFFKNFLEKIKNFNELNDHLEQKNTFFDKKILKTKI